VPRRDPRDQPVILQRGARHRRHLVNRCRRYDQAQPVAACPVVALRGLRLGPPAAVIARRPNWRAILVPVSQL